MKTRITSLLIALIALCSCSKEAIEPMDETFSKGHDQWYKVTFRFTEGKAVNKGKVKFNGFAKNNNFTYKTVQEYSLEDTQKGLKITGEPIKLIKGKHYGLEIFYYNKQGGLMNDEFTTKEMAPIHQHFFITDPKKGTLRQRNKNTIDYHYRDTNPSAGIIGDSNVALRGTNDPIGLKGYFSILDNPSKLNFDLNVVLVHVIAGVKQDRSGKAYPFYKPSSRVIGTRDLSVKIPMKIIGSTKDRNIIDKIAKEFHSNPTRVKKDISQRTLGYLKM